MQKKIGFIIGIVIIALAIGYLVFGRLEENLVYFVTPKELLAKGERAYEKSMRLGGMVQKGSIEWDSHHTSLKFLLTDGEEEIRVTSSSTPPQMFQEEMGVVVEGRLSKGVGPLAGTPYFNADRLMVKHSNEYHPPKEGEKPTVIYKDLTQ